MKILVVTQYFYPESFRINDLCKELTMQGHAVTVLTGLPNYPEGKLYEGYHHRQRRKETWQGINIIRIPIIPRMQNKVGLILNYFSFFINGCLWARFTKKQAFDLIYVFEVSPITVALPAITYKKRIYKPLIMNVQDLWPENVEAIMGVTNKAIIGVLNKLVDYIYRNCTLILTSSKCFVDNITSRGHSKDKVKFWPQYCEAPSKLEDKVLQQQVENEMPEGFNLVFTGNIGEAQGLDIILEAAQKTKAYPQINWILIGDGRARQRLEEDAKKQQLENLFFLGRKPENAIPYYLNKADCALLILSSNKVFDMTLPAKLQTYMACGKPILASVNGEAATLIWESQSGLCCPAGNSDTLAKAAIQLCQEDTKTLNIMAQNSKNCYLENFKKEKVLKELFNDINALE